MSRFVNLALATAVLALSATASSAQIYPLTSGPAGANSDAIDSAKGFDGINAVAPERELLYHPERAGSAAAELGAAAVPTGAGSVDHTARMGEHVRRHRRHASLH